MHELSVANSLIDVVMEHVIESGASGIERVIVEVGELSGVLPTALQTAFNSAIEQEPALRGAKLEIRPVIVALYCENCAAVQPAVSVQAMRCTVCGRPSQRVVRGRELEVVSIEVIDAATNA